MMMMANEAVLISVVLRDGGVICRRLLPMYVGRVAHKLPSLLIASLLLSIAHPTVSVEYCQFESFNASCAANQVIVIEEAHYGRLRIGRCVTRDYGYLGCTADVTDILDRSCSGQRWCHFSVPTLRDLVHPCPKDLTAYLEASYRCETVLKTNRLRCNDSVIFPTNSSTISLYVTMSPLDVTAAVASRYQLVPFSASCPVYVRSQSGQHLAVATYMFGVGGLGGPSNVAENDGEPKQSGNYKQQQQQPIVGGFDGSASQPVDVWHLQQRRPFTCNPDGSSGTVNRAGGVVYVVDHGRLKAIGEICSMPRYTHSVRGGMDLGSRVHHDDSSSATLGTGIYRSVGSVVGIFVDAGTGIAPMSDIALQDSVVSKDVDPGDTWWTSSGLTPKDRVTTAFIIRIQVIGCADIPVPENSRIERRRDVLTVRCNTSHETWYLTCKGHNWIGGLANCSRGVVSINKPTAVQARKSLSFGLMMAVGIGIVIGAVFGMTMLITVLVIRRQRRRQHRRRPRPAMTSSGTSCKSHVTFPLCDRNIFDLSHRQLDVVDASSSVDGYVTYAARSRSCPLESDRNNEAKFLRPTNYEPFYNVMQHSPRRHQTGVGNAICCSSVYPTTVTPPGGHHAFHYPTDLSYVHAVLPATGSALTRVSSIQPTTSAAGANDVDSADEWPTVDGDSNHYHASSTSTRCEDVLNSCSWWPQDVDRGCLERIPTADGQFPVALSRLPRSGPPSSVARVNVDEHDSGNDSFSSVTEAQVGHQPPSASSAPSGHLQHRSVSTAAHEQLEEINTNASLPTTSRTRVNLLVDPVVSMDTGGQCTRPDVVTTPSGGALN